MLEELRLEPHAWRRAAQAALCRREALWTVSTTREERSPRHELDQFRRQRGLWMRTDMDAWLMENGLSSAEFERLIHEEALLMEAASDQIARLTSVMVDHLRLSGDYASLLRRAQAKRAMLDSRVDVKQSPTELDMQMALEWYFERHSLPQPGAIAEYAIDAGWSGDVEFRQAVWEDYVFEKYRAMIRRWKPLHGEGTRFHLFPSYAEGYTEPEIVEVSLPPGSIGPGPSDPWMHVRNPIFKNEPYSPPVYVPPYTGLVYSPANPGRHGHFDEIAFGTEQFLAAHTYGTVRLVLDIWQYYLASPIVWWHADLFPEIELIPTVNWQNAQSGPGFIEMGQISDDLGRPQPFCLNFDVLAHETGHVILFSKIGVAPEVTEAFLAFHESFADLISMVAVLHFPSVRMRLLHQTWGNLYSLNVLTRFGAYSDTQQIRIASNQTRMAEVKDIRLKADGSWFDPSGLDRNQHAIAEPLTGAIFSVLVEIYQDELVSRRLINPELDARGWNSRGRGGGDERSSAGDRKGA